MIYQTLAPATCDSNHRIACLERQVTKLASAKKPAEKFSGLFYGFQALRQRLKG